MAHGTQEPSHGSADPRAMLPNGRVRGQGRAPPARASTPLRCQSLLLREVRSVPQQYTAAPPPADPAGRPGPQQQGKRNNNVEEASPLADGVVRLRRSYGGIDMTPGLFHDQVKSAVTLKSGMKSYSDGLQHFASA